MTGPQLAIDVSYARPNPQAVHNAGYTAVIRYLSGGTPGKDLTASEAATWHAANLGIAVVWETTGQRATDGADAGNIDGYAAVTQARQIGYPPGCPILANIGDFAATPTQIPAIAAYYDTFAHQITAAGYTQGGYATGYIIDHLAAGGRHGLWWQNAMNDNGQPGTAVSANAHIYQRTAPTRSIAGSAPGDYDENVLIAAPQFWGGTQPVHATTAPAPAAAPTAAAHKETRMFICNDGHTQYIVSEAANGLIKTELKPGTELAALAAVLPNQPLPMPDFLGYIPTAA